MYPLTKKNLQPLEEKTVYKNLLFNNVFYCSLVKKFCEENKIKWVLYDILNIIKKNKLIYFDEITIELKKDGDDSLLTFQYKNNTIIAKRYTLQKIDLLNKQNKVIFNYSNNTICYYN